MFGFILKFSNTHRNLLFENQQLKQEIARLYSVVAPPVPAEQIEATSNTLPEPSANELLSKPWLDIVLENVLVKLRYGIFAVHGTAVFGDIAEFGTMTGTTATELAKAIQISDKYQSGNYLAHGYRAKQLHLFDSFEGLPETDGEATDGASPHVASGIWGKGTCKGLTPEALHRIVSEYVPQDRVKVVKGWFCDALQTLPPETRYAMIHIDCDLYSSAKDVLDYVFSHKMVSVGCRIYFDDWDCNRASAAYGERKPWGKCVEKYAVKYSDLGSYGFVSHAFIIHEYRSGSEVVKEQVLEI